ncbi:MAG TPA: DUF5615 family PIN-like protein [Herpetosiphonaceae bacterium]|nr:DUF5615 family PIN-like protein [Herpetosiphonaceae bacterium]
MAEFYTDHNVAISVAAELRALGHGAHTARDRGLEAAGDDEHLLVAAEQGWILITHNRQHFRLLHAAWRRWTTAWYVSSRHAGILLLEQGIPPAQLAWEIHHFIPPNQPLSNTLYEWRRGSWTRH